MLRSAVRSGIRGGLTSDQILSDIEGRFPQATEGRISRLIAQEQSRQTAVDRVMARDFRRRTNLHAIARCGRGETVQAHITIRFIDQETGVFKEYGSTVQLRSTGVLGTILNEGIQTILAEARLDKYKPPEITSGDRGGNPGFRINYIECV